MAEAAEAFLSGNGFPRSRSWIHERMAGIGVPEEDIPALVRIRNEVTGRLREIRFLVYHPDLEGTGPRARIKEFEKISWDSHCVVTGRDEARYRNRCRGGTWSMPGTGRDRTWSGVLFPCSQVSGVALVMGGLPRFRRYGTGSSKQGGE